MGQKGHGKSRGLYLFLLTRKRKSPNGNKIFAHHRIVSAVKRVEFVSDRMSHIVLRGHWRNIIILNEHAPTEEKTVDSKYSFIRNYISFSISSLSAISKLRREDIFKPTVGNVSLHRDSNDNGVRKVNFATSNNLVFKSKMFPQQNILKYTWWCRYMGRYTTRLNTY